MTASEIWGGAYPRGPHADGAGGAGGLAGSGTGAARQGPPVPALSFGLRPAQPGRVLTVVLPTLVLSATAAGTGPPR
eukprot:CAMPEP_0185185192 /NCGR_PEP_ID=MMETSP1140-20130426/3098_1 /TAXON_ID=298111 /ORGANISM="Pavlova sp., Strain CCMP459" /LENGTH=76 /DNA_ID=CAMNT_0027751339 /DNA_START=33 /DNA_END=260 /DNA_ORIENTATION=+